MGVTFPGKGYKGRGVLLWKRNQAEWTEAKPLISRWVGGAAVVERMEMDFGFQSVSKTHTTSF